MKRRQQGRQKRRRWLRPSWTALLAVPTLVACGGSAPPAATAAEAAANEEELTVLSFRGTLEATREAEGVEDGAAIYHHVFLLGDTHYDTLTCYQEPDNCSVFLERPTGEEGAAVAHYLDDEDDPDVSLACTLQDGPTWAEATRAVIEVSLPAEGQVGVATVTRDATLSPPPGLQERLRAERRLRAAYTTIAELYQMSDHGAAQLPDPRVERPAPPPCRPVRVDEPQAVSWLGLEAPTVVSWAYSLQVDPDAGTVRFLARRDPACDGRLEMVSLEAQVDEHGDMVRLHPNRPEG
ncbi:MAG: hypothetical protein ACFCGT_00090 [Sandaracinaceae bacterium]